jgi:hypothetical protein
MELDTWNIVTKDDIEKDVIKKLQSKVDLIRKKKSNRKIKKMLVEKKGFN